MPGKTSENIPKDELTRKALRKQIAKTLELYRTPEKTPPKLKENLDAAFKDYPQTLQELEARIREQEEKERQERQRKIKASGVKIHGPAGKRKIQLD